MRWNYISSAGFVSSSAAGGENGHAGACPSQVLYGVCFLLDSFPTLNRYP